MARFVNRKAVIIVFVGLVIALVGVTGFHTPGYLRYNYKKMNMGMFGTQEIRTDRFTGRTEIYGAHGEWQPIEIDGEKVNLPEGTTILVK